MVVQSMVWKGTSSSFMGASPARGGLESSVVRTGREGKGAHCRTPCLEVSMPRSRLVFAFGSLACVAVAAAACTTSLSAPGTAEATGSTQAALTPAVAYHGIVGRRRRTAACRPDVAPAPNASYAPTGGCASPLQYYGGPIVGNPVVVQVSWNDPTSVVSASVETYLQTWWPAIISPQAGYLAWLTEYDTSGLERRRRPRRLQPDLRRVGQLQGALQDHAVGRQPGTDHRRQRDRPRDRRGESRPASCRCRPSTRTVTATRCT